MASYDIEITRTAEKQLKALPREDQRRLAATFLALADEPRPTGAPENSPVMTMFFASGSAATASFTALPIAS